MAGSDAISADGAGEVPVGVIESGFCVGEGRMSSGGRVSSRCSRCVGREGRSAEQFDSPVGVEEYVGCRPVVDDCTMRPRARCGRPPGAWKKPHRSALGRTSRHVPSKQSSGNP